jgi:DNA polymerase-3 subunit delta'
VAKKIAHRADGNYREALIHLQEHNTEDDDAVLFLSWMRNCYQFNITAINEFVDDISKRTREKQKLFLQTSLQIARECLMINYAAPSMVRFGGEELESFKRFAPFVNQNNAEQFSEELSKTHFHIERNGNAKILFFDLSITMNRLLHIK